jgi:peptide/nickel transport system ATP-binding protein
MVCATRGCPPVDDRALLSVRDLSIRLSAAHSERLIVDRVSFDVGAERVALVGESGSGKSLTARALLGLLRSPLDVSAERLEFEGQDLRALTPKQWAALRGSGMALILQDPRYALNPVLRIGRQMDEVLRIHQRLPAGERRDRTAEMMLAVGLAEPAHVARAFPHELSGGMGQRVMLAMMLVNGPRLLIADEPTSSLDEALRGQVLDLMVALVEQRRMGLLLISHDLQQVARYCERVLVMYRGEIVDERRTVDLAAAEHPYTRTLLSCRPGGLTYGTQLPVLVRDADERAERVS